MTECLAWMTENSERSSTSTNQSGKSGGGGRKVAMDALKEAEMQKEDDDKDGHEWGCTLVV